MLNLTRKKNQVVAKLLTRLPGLARSKADAWAKLELADTPWTPVSKPLNQSKVALVTTSGVHHKDQEPFNMQDPYGDPGFRVIDANRPRESLMITHDYYDHKDADRDINVVFPLDRLRELAAEGVIGAAAELHYGFMGHITGPHVEELMEKTAPAVAELLLQDQVDLVLLTPG